MKNIYIGLGVKNNNAIIKIANNDTKEVVISSCEIEDNPREEQILLLMKKIEDKIRETI